MIKFLHTGDLHLGLGFRNMNFNAEESRERRLELWETLERMLAYAQEKGMDFFLLAGDLYEDRYFTLGDIKRLRDLLGQAEDLKILIVAGNHDYRHKNSLYNKLDWPANVHIFSSDGLEGKAYKELDTIVYGYSWDRVNMGEARIFDGLSLEDDYENKILIIHGDVYTDSNYLPLKKEALEELGLDYVALGHIHKPEIFSSKLAYPGCPEPLHFGERGPRGFIEGRIGKGGTELKFVDFSKRKFLVERLEIDGEMTSQDIVDLFTSLDPVSRGKDYIRVLLQGYMDEDIDKLDLFKRLEKNFYYVEIVDQTILDYDLERLELIHKDNIIGRFIGEMRERDLSLAINKKALYYGLDVLLKEGS